MACTTEQFAVVMKGIRAMFPRFELDGNGMSIWYEALKDIEYSTLSRAAFNFGKKSKFPPSIAELREESKDIQVEETMFRLVQRRKQEQPKLIGPSTTGQRFKDIFEYLSAEPGTFTQADVDEVIHRQAERLDKERRAP